MALPQNFSQTTSELEGNHRLPSIKDAVDSFTVVLIEYRDSVLKDLVMLSIAAAEYESFKVSKAIEWENKKLWQKVLASIGTIFKKYLQ